MARTGAQRKRKRLPAEFADLLEAGDLDRLTAVFDTCALDARGGSTNKTALAFDGCPDELAHWLVERGGDLSAEDRYGETPLHTHAGSWRGRVATLLALGAAATVQGEVIRIAGRIARERDGNGGINWNASFRAMADAWLAHVGSGTPLPAAALEKASRIVCEVKRKHGDVERLCELAVAWVALNPEPVALPAPGYDL